MKQKGYVGIFYLIIILIIGSGWVKNIIKLTECDFEAPYKCEIIHGIGVVPIVGMITGWLDIEDGKVQEL